MRRLLKWVDAGPPEPDPYLYGWRDVRVEHPDGSETLDAVPLTLEDVLFPKVGDFISNGDWHLTWLTSGVCSIASWATTRRRRC